MKLLYVNTGVYIKLENKKYLSVSEISFRIFKNSENIVEQIVDKTSRMDRTIEHIVTTAEGELLRKETNTKRIVLVDRKKI